MKLKLQPDMQDYTPAARRYWWAAVTIGAWALAYAAWRLFQAPWSVLGIVAAGSIVAAVVALFPVHVPGLKVSLACADIFIVLTLLIAGLPGAVMVTFIEAFVGTLRTTGRWTSRMFSPAVNVSGFLLAGSAFGAVRPFLQDAMPGPLGLLVGLTGLSLIYYAITLFLNRLLFALKGGEPVHFFRWLWEGHLVALWLLASAAVAGLIYLSMQYFGWSTLLVAMPVIAMFLATYYALDRNAEMSRRKSEFLAHMSHELRTPLNAIIGGAQVLREGIVGPLNPRQDRWAQDIHESGEHLLAVINDILDISRIEAGRMDLALKPVEVAAVVTSALTLVRDAAARKRIELDAEVSADAGAVAADERKMKQVLLNLLSNAIKFTPEEGRVRIVAHRTAYGVEIAVHDTGIGIAPEEQGAVFDAFRQVGKDAAAKAMGSGLGLTLARDLVVLHGGTLELESERGGGSIFTVRLPE